MRGSIVIPAYNEEQALAAFVPALVAFVEQHPMDQQMEFTILVVDDGSTDRTLEVTRGFADTAAAIPVRSLSLVRNFGHQSALVAGMLQEAETADFVITMDADGEHPVSVIPLLIDHWRAGAHIVHTVRKPDDRVPITKRATSAVYYWVLARLSGLNVQAGMADFKLWDGDLLRQVASMLPNCGSTRAFASWLAPRGPIVRYEQNVASGRRSRFTSRKMWSLAIGGIVRYSELPLRLSIVVGSLALAFAAVLSAFVLWASFTGRTVPGWASIILTVAIFGAFQSFGIGILGEYILRNSFRQSLPKFVTRASDRTPDGNRRSV